MWFVAGAAAAIIGKKVINYVMTNTKFGQNVTTKIAELKEQAQAKINEARGAVCSEMESE